MKCIAIIGMPRSGSTIVASFFNSLPKAIIMGELHRAGVSKAIESRHGSFYADFADPNTSALSQLGAFAEEHGLWLYGIKDVLDNNRGFDPAVLMKEYEEQLDLILVLFRDPRRQWTSIVSLGHKKHIPRTEFVRRYREAYDSLGGKYVPFVYEKFIASPVGYARLVTGWDIPDKVPLQQYSGAGDVYARSSKAINKRDSRPAASGRQLDGVARLYSSLLKNEEV